MKHGTLTAYMKGCRCTDCKRANNKHTKVSYRRVPPPKDTRPTRAEESCGAPSIQSYNNGCRCLDCKYTARTYKEQRQRMRERNNKKEVSDD